MSAYTGRIELDFDLDAWDDEDAQLAINAIADEITRRVRGVAFTLTEPEVTSREFNVSAAIDQGAHL